MKFRKSSPSPTTIRQRQLRGGGRPQAFSYRSSRLDEQYNVGRQQPRGQDIRRREKLVRYWRQRLGVLIAGMVIIICLIDVLHVTPNPKIVPLTLSANSSFLQSDMTYQTAARKLFASSIFNGNKITINTDQIASQLKRQYPELADVSITLPLIGHRPIVYIAPATPSLIFAAKNSSFIVDNSGRALLTDAQAKDSDSRDLPIVTDQSGLSVTKGQAVLPSDSVTFIRTVAAELKLKGVNVKSYILPATAAYELDVYPNGVGYYIKFNLHSNDAIQQVGTYLAVGQRLKSQNTTPAAYIDVRVDGRAYYK